MPDLAGKKCVPCEGGVPPIVGDELETYLRQVHADWEVSPDGKKIHREFKFKNFAEALAFVDKVGEIAEAEDHHPDVHLAYGKVAVELWTHAIGGLSENDFILAAKIDKLHNSYT